MLHVLLCLSNRQILITKYYDDELLNQMGLLDYIRWSFARGIIGQFIGLRDHTYCNLTLEFLSDLHVDIIQGSRCQEGYISFYLQ